MSRQITGILTGAAGGIGRAIALRLAGQGARLIVSDLDEKALVRLADEFSSCESGTGTGQLIPVAGDMLDADIGDKLAEAAFNKFGEVTVLVNCSGWLKDARVQNMPVDTFRRLLDVNFVGPLRLIDAVLPYMQRQGYGRVISLASRAWLGNFGSSGYSTAKGALVGATRSLALAHARHGITVNCIAPGFIDTPMSRSMPPEVVDQVIESIPVGRGGTTDDVGALVSFLAGDESGYITGQTILSCGGRGISEPMARTTGEKTST